MPEVRFKRLSYAILYRKNI